ncbi:MAG: ATP-binding cassette domain-containing protein [Planctomycetales bacterium]|nr:ATP-binding cassette domain-containing protein [Planctomycetales bacterium]
MRLLDASSPPLIELIGATVVRDGVEILAAATWRLDRGRHWAILGPNGSGKSTLLRVACGYVWPNRGAVRRLGEELIDLAELRRSIGWVAGDMAAQIPARERAIETVVSGKLAMVGLRRLPGVSPTDADFTAARELLRAMHCDALVDKPFGVLSQGERQQVLVAQARMVDPLLIVLDEPCAGMDPGVRERFLAWLDAVAASPASPTLALATHHVEEIMPSFESTLLMSEGKIVAAGPTGEVVTAEHLAALYGVSVDRLDFVRGRRWPVWHVRAEEGD